jgi:hypothetical protein
MLCIVDAECHVCFIAMLCVIMPSAIMPIVIMLNVVALERATLKIEIRVKVADSNNHASLLQPAPKARRCLE